MPATATGRGAQVVLTEAQRQVARGIFSTSFEANQTKQKADHATGAAPLPSSPDGTTTTGIPATDVVTTAMPWLVPSASYANDAAAQAGGVPIGGLYRQGSVVCVRVA